MERDNHVPHTYPQNNRFQLTRSRGAWLWCVGNSAGIWNFNSHAHVERDTWNKCTIFWTYISTHTLTWSVTRIQWSQAGFPLFQLTRSRGAWHTWNALGVLQQSFQLTRSRGAWPVAAFLCSEPVEFQLTRSRGAWHAEVSNTAVAPTISTHTLTWSVTGNYGSEVLKARISTHTLTWSVTSDPSVTMIYALFQLTRSRGAWLRRP